MVKKRQHTMVASCFVQYKHISYKSIAQHFPFTHYTSEQDKITTLKANSSSKYTNTCMYLHMIYLGVGLGIIQI